MTRRKLSALMLAAGLSVAWSCGGGSNNSDNSANNPANSESNTANNQNNAANNQNNSTAFWNAAITGLEEQEDMPLPAEGFGGDSFGKAGNKLLGNSDIEPKQTFTITVASGSELDSTGEKVAGILISWGDPRIECISNLDDKFNPVGGTVNITSTDPVKGSFDSDMDCYIQTDAGSNAVEAQISGEFEAFPGI